MSLVSLRVLLLSFIDTFCILNDLTDAVMDKLLQYLFFKNKQRLVRYQKQVWYQSKSDWETEKFDQVPWLT